MNKYLNILAFLCFLAQSQRIYDIKQSKSLFNEFRQTHNKKYKNILDYNIRYRIFTKNLEFINKMNAANDGVEYRINKFGDLSQNEFRKLYLGNEYKVEVEEQKDEQKDEYIQQEVKEWDWREKGAVTEVKDQKQFGSCWAFSTAGNIEGQHFLETKELISLSVEQILECDATIDEHSNRADCGVFGGWPYLAMQYIIQAGGLASEQDYPYCIAFHDNQQGKCWPCSAQGYDTKRCGQGLFPPSCKQLNPCKININKKAKISGWKQLSSDEKILKQQLIQYGPLSVGLDAGWLQFYHHGIYDPWLGCSSTQLNHAVLMVGFGGDDHTPYWNIKNSWGNTWGEQGYFRITRGKNTCGIATNPVTALTNHTQQIQ